jgi:sugar phosphate isomerase/epimerase
LLSKDAETIRHGTKKDHSVKFLICLKGDSEQHPFLPRIMELGAGIELQSYGMQGIVSETEWQKRVALHQEMIKDFQGDLAMHGPFIGMDYNHLDHLIDAAINKRMDMIYDTVRQLGARTVVLHTSFTTELERFSLEEQWFKKMAEFWQREILRWAGLGVTVVLENVVEKSPNTMVRLAEAVENPFFGLCLDIGHQNIAGGLTAGAWIERMGGRLRHVHLHDNNGKKDEHLPIGRGTIDFQPIFRALHRFAPEAALSLEVDSDIETKVNNLADVIERFGAR